MCLTGGKPKDPGTWEEYQAANRERGGGPTRADYDAAVKRWEGSDEFKAKKEEAKTIDQQQAEQEAEIAEAKKTEAEKTTELKEKTTEAAIAQTTAPVSTMDSSSVEKQRQKELSIGVDDVGTSDAAFKESSTMIKKKNDSAVLRRRRGKKRGRRSLITGLSGGGIGYYSKFFT